MPTKSHSLLIAVDRMRSALRTRTLQRALLTTLRDAAACALVLAAVGAFFPVPVVARVLTVLFLVALAAVAVIRVARPVRRVPDMPATASLVDEMHPELRGGVAPAVDLALRGTSARGASEDLARAAIDAAGSRVGSIDPGSVARARIPRLPVRSVAMAVVAVVLGTVLWPNGLGRALVALARPDTVRAPHVDITVRPGDIVVPSGATVSVIAEVREDAASRERVSAAPIVWTKNAGGDWTSVAMARAGTRASRSVTGEWRARLEKIDRDVTYRVGVGQHDSREYAIRVLADPALVSAHVTYHPPAYSGQTEQSLDQPTGDLAGLEGTTADVVYQINTAVSAARLVGQDGVHGVIALAVESDGRSVRGRVPLRASGRYALNVTPRIAQHEQSVEGSFALSVTPDAPPMVRLVNPPDATPIPREMHVTIEMQANDDFGLRSISLVAWKEGSEQRDRRALAAPGGAREFEASADWDLHAYGLTPGATLLYCIEATDNNAVRGPQTARSEVRRLVFPTLAEIYADAASEHKESAENLSELLQQGKDVRKELEAAAREAQSSKTMSWEDKQALQQSLEQQQKIADNIENVTKQLDETLNKLQQESQVSDDLLRKVAEIQNLVKNLGNEELRKAIQRLSDALRGVNPNDMKNAMAQLQMTQEELMKRLDRTIALLQKIQREEKLEALARETEELAKEQQQMNEQMERERNAAEQADAAERQSQMAKQTEQAQKDTRELSEQMKKDEPQASEQLAQAAQEMEQQAPQTAMQRASQMMKKGDQKGAQQQGQKAQQDLDQMSRALRDAQKKMQAQQTKELAEAMENVARDMLSLSNRQETMSQRTQGESTSDLAERQAALKEETENVANRLFELGRKTPFISQNLAEAVGKALQESQQSTDGFERGNRSMGEQRARASSSALNQAVTQLLEAKESACSGGQGSGQSTAQSLMQRLQSLSQMQGQVNAESQQLMEGQTGQPRLTPSAQGQLARLAAQQEMIQKGLSDLSREAGEARDQLRKLDRVADDMKSVTQDMQANRVTPDLIDKQHKILSRLLDAQHAVDKRDYEKERTSESGIEVTVQSPGAIPSSALNERDRLTIDLLRAKSDPVPPEYRRAIDAYFRALTGSGGNR